MPEVLKTFLKKILPVSVLRIVAGLVYGWHGNYSSWSAAKKHCSGYESESILEKVRFSQTIVKDGKAAYERDSVLFKKREYSYPLLSGLMWAAALNNGKLNVLDFGGSLGSTYFQNKLFLDTLESVHWCIVEQPGFVKIGLEQFSTGKLHFFKSVEECLESYSIDVVLLSSVLQYLEEPFKLLGIIKTSMIKIVIIDRTPFVSGNDRIAIQRVNPSIYKASYPCWFFNEEKLVGYLEPEYELVLDFNALDRANISSEFKGFIFKLTI
jgi:putative methyltransferase (TIGR04325 family)